MSTGTQQQLYDSFINTEDEYMQFENQLEEVHKEVEDTHTFSQINAESQIGTNVAEKGRGTYRKMATIEPKKQPLALTGQVSGNLNSINEE